jgi:hypothetical protein
MHRLAMMLLSAVAMTLLPPGQATAAGSIASCFHSWTDSVSPGIGSTPSRSRFTSHGETWTLTCQGFVRGNRVTGPGTFGEEGVVDGTCASGSGEVTFSFTIPTTAGDQKFRLTFPFVYGPGGGTARTDVFPGVFLFFPKTGDCINEPITEFNVLRGATLLT